MTGTINLDKGELKFSWKTLAAIIVSLITFGGAVLGGAISVTAWKENVESHLQRTDDHLQNEDKQFDDLNEEIKEINRTLEWLKTHNSDARDIPMHEPHGTSFRPPLIATKTVPAQSMIPPLKGNH